MNFYSTIHTGHTIFTNVSATKSKIETEFKKLAKTVSTPFQFYLFDAPLEPKPKSKNGIFTVDGANELTSFVRSIPNQSIYKDVYIGLMYPEYGDSAQSSLLKLLEESNPNIHIIIFLQSNSKLYETIHSRMQTVDVHPFTNIRAESDKKTFSTKPLSYQQRLEFDYILKNKEKIAKQWLSDLENFISPKKPVK